MLYTHRNVHQKSNSKNIKLSFAKAECRREFHKALQHTKPDIDMLDSRKVHTWLHCAMHAWTHFISSHVFNIHLYTCIEFQRIHVIAFCFHYIDSCEECEISICLH